MEVPSCTPWNFFLSQKVATFLFPFVFSFSHAFSFSSLYVEALFVSLLVALVFYFLVKLVVNLLSALIDLITFSLHQTMLKNSTKFLITVGIAYFERRTLPVAF